MAELKGGTKLLKELRLVSEKLNKAATVGVGFYAKSTYPDGTPVGYIASIQEFGATIEHPGGTKYITDAVIGKGANARIVTRFVKNDFQGETKTTGAHTITIPSRPFFRTMIAEKSPAWGNALGGLLKDDGLDAKKALSQMGDAIIGQLQDSILATNDPPNSPATIRAKKGRAKPLIDTGHMWNSVTKEVI